MRSGRTPKPTVLEALADREVVLWPDNDEPGRRQMRRIAEALMDVAAEVRVYTWPGAPDKGDAADHPVAGSADGLNAADQLLKDLLAAPPFESGDAGDTGDADSWELPEAESFPVAALPASTRRYVEEAAKALVCPPEMVGLPLLVEMGSAIGNSRTIKLKESWEEGPTLYAAVVAHPGEKKSPAASVAMRPARKVQASLVRRYREELVQYKAREREYERDKRECRKLDLADPAPPEEPVMERTFVDDTTVEALAVTLAENKRGVMVARDELDAWVRSMDQYKTGRQGADRQLWLTVWSSEPINVDRKGQLEPIILARPSVGVNGSIQPAILPELGGGRKDGLLNRFLFACPERMPSRWTDEEISEEATEGIQALYEKLRALELDEYDDPAPKPIRFESDAKDAFTQFLDQHREEMEAPGFPECLLGPRAKLEAYFARLTLILCLMRCVDEGAEERVESKDVLFASAFIDYFKNHARRVYLGLYGDNARDKLARDVFTFLKDRGGHVEDEPHVLHHELVSDHKPYRPDELSKVLLEIAGRTPQLEVTRGWKGRGNNKRRSLKLSLRNGVPGVPGVPAA